MPMIIILTVFLYGLIGIFTFMFGCDIGYTGPLSVYIFWPIIWIKGLYRALIAALKY